MKEKQELERERDGIRYALVTLRQERRELKEELKMASGKEMQSKEDMLLKLFSVIAELFSKFPI